MRRIVLSGLLVLMLTFAGGCRRSERDADPKKGDAPTGVPKIDPPSEPVVPGKEGSERPF